MNKEKPECKCHCHYGDCNAGCAGRHKPPCKHCDLFLSNPFLEINKLAHKITDLSYEAAITDNEKKREKYMNKIIDAAEPMEEVYTTSWH